MPDRLAGIVLKLSRAEEHLGTLKESIEGFVEGDFYSVYAEPDRQRRIVVRVGDVEPLRPEWGVLVGEVVYNFRSALDHLAFELARAHMRDQLTEDIAGSSAFPIFRTGPSFRRRSTKGQRRGQPDRSSGLHKIRGVSPKARAAIQRLQPYHRWKNPGARSLLQLEELSNVDKHRTLHLSVAQLASSRWGLRGTGFARLEKIEVFPAPFEPNAMLARFTGEFPLGPEGDMHVDSEMLADIAFDRKSPARSIRGRSVLDTLYGVRNFIAGQVIPDLMPCFPPGERVWSRIVGPESPHVGPPAP